MANLKKHTKPVQYSETMPAIQALPCFKNYMVFLAIPVIPVYNTKIFYGWRHRSLTELNNSSIEPIRDCHAGGIYFACSSRF